MPEIGGGTGGGSVSGIADVPGLQSALDNKEDQSAQLDAIAALSGTTFGRTFLELADAAAARTKLALGSAATHAHSDYDAAGAAAAAQAASQPLDSDLTALAALATTSFGRSLLTLADAAALAAAHSHGGSSTPNRALYAKKAGLLDPNCQLPLLWGMGTLRAITTPRLYLQTGWQLKLSGTAGLMLREPNDPLPLRNVTITGMVSNSAAVLMDPTLATHSDAEADYYAMKDAIDDLDTHYLPIGANTSARLLPGPYGIMITGLTTHELVWLGLYTPRGPAAGALSIHDELADGIGTTSLVGGGTGYAGQQRIGRRYRVPMSKRAMAGIVTGVGGAADSPFGSVTYVILPSDFTKVVDSTSYTFRDDFMGASLDTATKWTRTQSTAGNVEINTEFAWCKLHGNNSWGTNGFVSQTGFSRQAGRTFECDVAPGGGNDSAGYANCIVGFHDGSGVADTDMVHGIDFTTGGTGHSDLYIFENGNNRGVAPNSNGYTLGAIYRVRITIQSTTSHAKYEIQGGPEYPPIGGSSWTDISPAATSSTTTPLYAGAVVAGPLDTYVSDMKLYG